MAICEKARQRRTRKKQVSETEIPRSESRMTPFLRGVKNTGKGWGALFTAPSPGCAASDQRGSRWDGPNKTFRAYQSVLQNHLEAAANNCREQKVFYSPSVWRSKASVVCGKYILVAPLTRTQSTPSASVALGCGEGDDGVLQDGRRCPQHPEWHHLCREEAGGVRGGRREEGT